MPNWKPRKWWYDIECNTGDDNFTTVIAVIDSDLDEPVVFAWADERTNCPWLAKFDGPFGAYTNDKRADYWPEDLDKKYSILTIHINLEFIQ